MVAIAASTIARDPNIMANGRVLVVAGSDSSGGAGMEASQKVIAAHGCYALTATTALTAQNTCSVNDIHYVPPEFTRKQIDAVFADIVPDVVKIGMLGTVATIEMLAQALKDYSVDTVILDPVMVSTSGAQLLPQEAVSDLRTLLLPHAFMVTPNVPEAKLLLSGIGKELVNIECVDDLETLAREISKLGPKWVLVKGGHVPFKKDGTIGESHEGKEIVVNVLLGPSGEVTRIESAYQDSRNTHGTGCSLASAIASNLSKGIAPVEAVRSAVRFVDVGIKTAPGYGKGHGPLNHFHAAFALPFSAGYFLEYLLHRPDVAPVWHRYINHPFVLGLGSGELPLESFKGYLMQDYLYLIHFARANALASCKAKNGDDIAAAAKIVTEIYRELKLHINYCKGFGISKEEMEATEEHQACTAYTRYVMDIGQSEDWFGLQIALSPCLLGYGAIGKQLLADPKTKKGDDNTYWTWIRNYAADDFKEAVKTGSALLEKHAIQQSPSRIEQIVKIFICATKMEIAFWEMFPSK